jgi:hypothetical protein
VFAVQVTSPIELNLLTEEEYYKHLKQVRAQQHAAASATNSHSLLAGTTFT